MWHWELNHLCPLLSCTSHSADQAADWITVLSLHKNKQEFKFYYSSVVLLSETNHCHISSLRAAVFCANLSARSYFFAACIAQEQCEKRWSLSSVLAGQGYLSPVISRGSRGLVIPFFLQMVSCYMAAGKCRPHISLYLKKHRDLKKILDCKDFLLFCDFSVTRDYSTGPRS